MYVVDIRFFSNLKTTAVIFPFKPTIKDFIHAVVQTAWFVVCLPSWGDRAVGVKSCCWVRNNRRENNSGRKKTMRARGVHFTVYFKL